MATTQPVTDATAQPNKSPVSKRGHPIKGAREARERAKRDPLASIEGDTSLDEPPEHKTDAKARIPKPPFFRYGTDQPAPHRPEHFFAWWNSLSAGAKGASLAYVYRNYPVIQIKVPDKKSPTGFRPSNQIDKRSGSDPLAGLDDVLHYYGSGDYTIRLNQASPGKTVCLCVIKGLRDQDHPPVVDLTTLAIEDPVNKPYIEGLRMKGIRIPGVDPMEESDMAAAATMDHMVGTIERLTERNALLASRPPSAPLKVEREPMNESIVSQALATGMGIIATASDTQNKMLEKTMEKISQLRGDSGGSDPLALLDKVGNLLKTFAPAPVVMPNTSPNSADAMLAAAMARSDRLETRIFEMQTSQLNLLQGMLAKSQESPAVAAAQSRVPAAAGTPATPMEMLRDLVKLKEGLGSLTGDTERGENPAAAAAAGPWWAAALNNLPALGQVLLGIMALYSQASYNNAIAATAAGPGQTAALPIAPTMPAIPAPEPTLGDEIPPPPPGGGAPLPHPGDATMSAYHTFLAQLENPLRLSLENNETGDEFAEKLVEFHGQMAYDLLHNLGKDQLINILSTYPPIWQVVTAIPQKFQQFLDEFMSYGEAPPPPPPAQLHLPHATHAPIRPLESKAQAAEPGSADVTDRMDRLHSARAGGGGKAAAGSKPPKEPAGPQA